MRDKIGCLALAIAAAIVVVFQVAIWMDDMSTSHKLYATGGEFVLLFFFLCFLLICFDNDDYDD